VIAQELQKNNKLEEIDNLKKIKIPFKVFEKLFFIWLCDQKATLFVS
jgi:hypothetical protein